MLRNREVLLYAVFAAVITAAAFVLCLPISLSAAVVTATACLCVCAVCATFTVRRYRKIAELSDYLRRLTCGKPMLDIRENAEGELSILKNEIYKVTVALTEQAAALQKDKLELANALSDISHQLKTPLTSLGIMADLLENDDLPPEKRREFILSIRERLGKMEWLVLLLLKLARLDADAVSLKKVSIPLAELVRKAVSPMLIPMEIKRQIYRADGEDAAVVCDPDWTAEALGNIIKNAVENTPEDVTIDSAYGTNALFSYITVRDSGPGAAKADIPHLFKRFYRGQNASRDGIGIGLAMSLAILRKQNGDIEAANDGGGVFTVKFYRTE